MDKLWYIPIVNCYRPINRTTDILNNMNGLHMHCAKETKNKNTYYIFPPI